MRGRLGTGTEGVVQDRRHEQHVRDSSRHSFAWLGIRAEPRRRASAWSRDERRDGERKIPKKGDIELRDGLTRVGVPSGYGLAETLRRFRMLHWKNRTALILFALAAVVASAGGEFIRGAGLYW
jgi:hypothetical protein